MLFALRRRKPAATPVVAAAAANLKKNDPMHIAPQRVWGEGFLSPGGRDFVLDLLGRLDIKEGMLVAELEAGLGGAGCVAAREMKVRVSAIGSSKELATAGSEIWGRLNVHDRVTAVTYDPTSPSLPKAAFDHAFAKDGIGIDAGFLAAVRDSLLPNGHVVLAQVVGAGDGLKARDVALLAPQRPGMQHLTPHGELLRSLREIGLKVTKDDATSGAFAREIRRGWLRFAETLRARPGDRGDVGDLLVVGEGWARIVALLDGGSLEHHTIVAKRS